MKTGRRVVLRMDELKKRKRKRKRFEFELEPGRTKVQVVEAPHETTPTEGKGYGDIASAHSHRGSRQGRENERTCDKIKRRLICAANG